MYTLKGIFPEPKKEQKKNFIRENMKQLKMIQGKSPKEPKYTTKSGHQPTFMTSTIGQVKSSSSNKSAKVISSLGKNHPNARNKHQDIKIKKGDMAEFLKRKEMRQAKPIEVEEDDEKSSDSSLRLRDIGCQTIESNLAQKLNDCTKLTMLYPTKDDDNDGKLKASGDSGRRKSPAVQLHSSRTGGDEIMEERNRSRINAILERKDKDPYLPSGYQKGVLPKYLRERKDQTVKDIDQVKFDDNQAVCPPGHVTLPDNERKETLRMLRNSFAELVSELNKMPVKTDTLRMRNRKMELEKQLAKLEEGIKVFSRPKVFVKIGE